MINFEWGCVHLKAFNKLIDKADNFFGYIAAATLFLMMLLVFLDVFFRNIFGSPIQGTLEMTGEYFMVVVVYFGIGYTLKEDGHVSVEFFEDKIPNILKKPFEILGNIVALIAVVVLGYSNFLKGIEYFEKDIRSISLLNYPLAPALMIISLGLLFMAIRLVIRLIDLLTKHPKQEISK